MKKILSVITKEELDEIIDKKKIPQKKFENIMEELELDDDYYEELVEGAIEQDIVIAHDEDNIEFENDEKFENYYTEDIINQYFHDISGYSLLNKQDEILWIEKAKNGDKEAKEQIVMSNLRLVAKIALHYCKSGIYYLDLIQLFIH